MDGYAICMDHNTAIERIARHADSPSRLIRALEDCVPDGSRIVGIVISHGSQNQARPPLSLVS